MLKVHNCCARECKRTRQCWFLGQAWWDISGIFSQGRQQCLLPSGVALAMTASPLSCMAEQPRDTAWGHWQHREHRILSHFCFLENSCFCFGLKQTFASLWCRGWSSAWQSLLIRNFSKGASGSPPDQLIFPSLSLRCFPVFQVPGLPLPMPRNTPGEEGNGFWCQYQNWWSSDGKITGVNDLSLVFVFNNMVESYAWKLRILLKQEDFWPY